MIITNEGVMVQWCNPVTFQPERSGGQVPAHLEPLLFSIMARGCRLVKSSVLLGSQCVALKSAISLSLILPSIYNTMDRLEGFFQPMPVYVTLSSVLYFEHCYFRKVKVFLLNKKVHYLFYLDTGRPFAVELINPRRTKVREEEMIKLQTSINESCDLVAVNQLQTVSK